MKKKSEVTLAQAREGAKAQTRMSVRSALERAEWSLSKAAAALGVKPSSLQSVIKTVGLEAEYREHARPRGRPRVDHKP